MPSRSLVIAFVGTALSLAACKGPDSGAPGTSIPVVLTYPPGVHPDLPTAVPATDIAVQAQVKSASGLPAPGVVVYWDGGAFPSPVFPEVDTTDVNGMSMTVWHLRSLLGQQSVRAYIDGATGSPLEYRVLVVAGPPPPPPPPPSVRQSGIRAR